MNPKLRLESRHVSLEDVKADVYGGRAAGDLTFYLSGKNASFKTNARVSGINVATVARLSGASLKDGKLQFPLRIGGTIASPVFSKGKGEKDVDAVQKPR